MAEVFGFARALDGYDRYTPSLVDGKENASADGGSGLPQTPRAQSTYGVPCNPREATPSTTCTPATTTFSRAQPRFTALGDNTSKFGNTSRFAKAQRGDRDDDFKCTYPVGDKKAKHTPEQDRNIVSLSSNLLGLNTPSRSVLGNEVLPSPFLVIVKPMLAIFAVNLPASHLSTRTTR